MKLERSSPVPWDAASRRDGLSPAAATLTARSQPYRKGSDFAAANPSAPEERDQEVSRRGGDKEPGRGAARS